MFEKIIGNEHNKKVLEKAVENKNISHSYMFIGQTGIGKLLFAKEFAKKILLEENKTEENIPDLYIIEPDGNSIKIDQIREITKKILEKPIASERKIYIINNSELMTTEAQNGLLKTLEEPPQYAIIILITQGEDLFLPTIKSRCTKIRFNKLSNQEIKEILQKNNYSTETNEEMFKAFDGSIEKALNLINKQETYVETSNFINSLEQTDKLEVMNFKEKIFKDKEQAQSILEFINTILIDIALKRKNIKYANCIQILESAKDRLNKNCNYDMTIDNCLIAMWEEING